MNKKLKIFDAMSLLCNIGGVSFDAKSELFERVSVPVGTYGAESWAMIQREPHKLDVMKKKGLQSLCHVTNFETTIREEVRHRAGATTEMSYKMK